MAHFSQDQLEAIAGALGDKDAGLDAYLAAGETDDTTEALIEAQRQTAAQATPIGAASP